MDDANNPEMELAVETESTAPEAEKPTETQSAEEASEEAVENTETVDGEAEEGAEDTAPEFVSVEYDGTEYEVPPQLKDALMRQSDYTKKTQTLAEQTKQVEAQATAIKQQSELQQQSLDDVAQIKAIEKSIEQYNALDWNQLAQDDQTQYLNLDRQKRDLETERQNAITRLQQNQAKAIESQRAEHARIIEEGQRVLSKEIENWTPELAQSIATYGISQGLDERAVQSITDPVHVKLIDKARRYDELMAKQKAKPKTPEPQQAVKVKGKRANPTKDPDKMSTDEWLKMRNKQLSQRANA